MVIFLATEHILLTFHAHFVFVWASGSSVDDVTRATFRYLLAADNLLWIIYFYDIDFKALDFIGNSGNVKFHEIVTVINYQF